MAKGRAFAHSLNTQVMKISEDRDIEQIGWPTSIGDGDAWTYICVKRISYFFAAFSIGKWTQETCRAML